VDWQIPVLATEATTGRGAGLLAEIRRHRAALEASGALEARRRARRRQELLALLVEEVSAAVERRVRAGDLAETLERVATGQIDPYSAAQAILARPGVLDGPPSAGERADPCYGG
jgi:LAO/AO transport system kinase